MLLLKISLASANPADTLRIRLNEKNTSLLGWYLNTQHDAKNIYDFQKNKQYSHYQTLTDTFVRFEFVQIDSSFYSRIEQGNTNAQDIEEIFRFYKDEALSHPESYANRVRMSLNSYDYSLHYRDKRQKTDFNHFYYDSFLLPFTENRDILGKQKGKEFIQNYEWVFVQNTLPFPVNESWVEDNAGLQGMPTDFTEYNDSWGFALPPDFLDDPTPGRQHTYLGTENTRLDLITTRITQADYVQNQVIFIGYESKENMLIRYNRYCRILRQNPKLFDTYLDSSDQVIGTGLKDTMRGFGIDYIREYSQITLPLKKGQLGFTGLTPYGYHIIRATSDPEKRNYRLWCKPKFYRLKQ